MSVHRYQQVYESIKMSILNENDMKKLPDERSLAEQYSVSRTTIRKALALLKENNLIDVKQGSGIYVKGEELIQSQKFGSLTQDLKSIGKKVTTDIISTSIINKPATGDMSVFTGNKIARIERIRSISDVKVIQEINYLCLDRLPDVEVKIRQHPSLYELLSCVYSVKFDRGYEKLTAGFILLDTAEKLETSATNCAVKVIRSTFEKDRLIEYTISYTLADHFCYQYELDDVKMDIFNEKNLNL
ncbi:GntR family transcriptional regulator [Photobacterium sp. DNB23_23_1]